MITPIFRIDQDDAYLYVEIRAPMARIKDTELEFDGNHFYFYSKPYYLRLNLPGNVSQCGDEKIEWDCEKNVFNVRVPKTNVGEKFEGLSMISELLSKPKKAVKLQFPVEEIDDDEVLGERESDDKEGFNWFIEQQLPGDVSLTGEKYGFNQNYQHVIEKLAEEIYDLLDIKEPDKITLTMRKQQRLAKEYEDFDESHYLSDIYDQHEIIDQMITMRLDWRSDAAKFTDDEIFKLKNLPKRSFLLSKNDKFRLLLGVVDILIAYCYDLRTTEQDHTSESGWTVTKLSSTLTWFDYFGSLNEVLVSAVRRQLCYPLFRNFKLALKTIDDCIVILKRGPEAVISCFLDIHRIFNESGDLRYLLNNLYITDYLIWLQKVRENTLFTLATAMEKINITKEMIELDLLVIEEAAELVIDENKEKDLILV